MFCLTIWLTDWLRLSSIDRLCMNVKSTFFNAIHFTNFKQNYLSKYNTRKLNKWKGIWLTKVLGILGKFNSIPSHNSYYVLSVYVYLQTQCFLFLFSASGKKIQILLMATNAGNLDVIIQAYTRSFFIPTISSYSIEQAISM